MYPENYCSPRRHMLFGKGTKQPLSNSEPEKPWKYKQLWGLRPDPSYLWIKINVIEKAGYTENPRSQCQLKSRNEDATWAQIFVCYLIRIPFKNLLVNSCNKASSTVQRQSLGVVLMNFTKFTGKHLCWSLFVSEELIEKWLQHRCFPVNFANFLRMSVL